MVIPVPDSAGQKGEINTSSQVFSTTSGGHAGAASIVVKNLDNLFN